MFICVIQEHKKISDGIHEMALAVRTDRLTNPYPTFALVRADKLNFWLLFSAVIGSAVAGKAASEPFCMVTLKPSSQFLLKRSMKKVAGPTLTLTCSQLQEKVFNVTTSLKGHRKPKIFLLIRRISDSDILFREQNFPTLKHLEQGSRTLQICNDIVKNHFRFERGAPVLPFHIVTVFICK